MSNPKQEQTCFFITTKGDRKGSFQLLSKLAIFKTSAHGDLGGTWLFASLAERGVALRCDAFSNTHIFVTTQQFAACRFAVDQELGRDRELNGCAHVSGLDTRGKHCVAP